MDIFAVLSLIGGLSLFLFGMNVMGQALERRAGSSLKGILGKLTGSRIAGLLTGIGVTAVIQSSSATTVMVVGFVNSGLMQLKQAINVIMGANIGTTVTAWVLSLSGIGSANIFVKLLKPSSFTPILALVGIIYYLMSKKQSRKDLGLIFLGFSTLMFGMEAMSAAVSGLGENEAFRQLMVLFSNPVLGVLAGMLVTAVIQSSSASVGILQALASTGAITYGTAIPVIMGQNIGTCVTTLLSSVGATKNAKRTAAVHLFFNIIGTVVWLVVFCIVKAVFAPAILKDGASLAGIAVIHSAFNIACTVLLFPFAGALEKLVVFLIPDSDEPEVLKKLDERLMSTPSIAIQVCQDVTCEMAQIAVRSMNDALTCLTDYSPKLEAQVKSMEELTDLYEDGLASYLVKLSTKRIAEEDYREAAKLLKVIGDLERIGDHAEDIVDSAEEIRLKQIPIEGEALRQLNVLMDAVKEILSLSLEALSENDLEKAFMVEPLEQVIDAIKEQLRREEIGRLQRGNLKRSAGFVWNDILTAMERTSDHCSNIAGAVIDAKNEDMNMHKTLRQYKNSGGEFSRAFQMYAEKYTIFLEDVPEKTDSGKADATGL